MNYKLGKLPDPIRPKLKLMDILIDKKLPTYPDVFAGPSYNLQMWGNDKYGDCVFVALMNCQTRSELFEQKIIIPVTTKWVVSQYLKLSGGEDNGLVPLDTVKVWQKKGFTLNGRIFKCFSYADAKVDPNYIKAVTSLIGDAWCGFDLPENYDVELKAGKPWTDTSMPARDDYGHMMAVGKYDKDWCYLKTWGQYQPASWPWAKKFMKQHYAIIDAPDTWVKHSPVDVNSLTAILKQLQG